ncbi:hypothetical protein FVE85_4732 [Porphyridium purpureum]|uniref:Major facilitator superfamily (MFS) profile domain-containing protein n=1 Tax=Porphyridium purpureum TaxID=35688 RepID=A0A5J4YQS9_PORPP|nr:hypothetical protein FVE85_4732 [Porphyridium purpureum]|eukprot:POR7467..scf236_6
MTRRWSITWLACMAHALHVACVSTTPAVLLGPVRASLQLSVAQILIPTNVFRVVQAVGLLPLGVLLDSLDRAVIRFPVILGLAMAVTAMLAYPLASRLSHLVLLQIFCSTSLLLAGIAPLLVLVDTHFADGTYAKTATGIVLSGYSMASCVAPVAISRLEALADWQAAFRTMGATFLLLGVVPVILFLHPAPKSPAEPSVIDSETPLPSVPTGSEVDLTYLSNQARAEGEAASGTPTLNSSAVLSRRVTARSFAEEKSESAFSSRVLAPIFSTRVAEWSNRLASLRSVAMDTPLGSIQSSQQPEASPRSATSFELERGLEMRERQSLLSIEYALLLGVVGMFSFSSHVLLDQLVLFSTEELGATLSKGSWLFTLLNLFGLLAKLASGALAERIHPSVLLLGATMSNTLSHVLIFTLVRTNAIEGDGTVLHLAMRETFAPYALFSAVYGIGYGAVFSLSTAVLRDFGDRFALRTSLNLATLFAAGAVGSSIAGVFRTTHGTFLPAFLLQAGAAGASAALALAFFLRGPALPMAEAS